MKTARRCGRDHASTQQARYRVRLSCVRWPSYPCLLNSDAWLGSFVLQEILQVLFCYVLFYGAVLPRYLLKERETERESKKEHEEGRKKEQSSASSGQGL